MRPTAQYFQFSFLVPCPKAVVWNTFMIWTCSPLGMTVAYSGQC